MQKPTLEWQERLFHRDRLRAGRYAALADAEGFHEICYALEALGLRLHGAKEALGTYKEKLSELAAESLVLGELSEWFPGWFSRFDALFELVKSARNDAMHSGVYARHATSAAIKLCIGLEEALMKEQQMPRTSVQDFMVKSPVTVDSWQPVALARQLMLTHSFSFLPVQVGGKWKLISESAMAKYLRQPEGSWKKLLASSIADAEPNGLVMTEAIVVDLAQNVTQLPERDGTGQEVRLWLVQDKAEHLCGVLSPFELM